MIVKEEIEQVIRKYLAETFKNEDALPNVIIEGLAEAIAKDRFVIYGLVDEEYNYEDIDMVASDRRVELSDKEKGDAYWRYKKVRDNDDSIQYLYDIIDEIVERRERGEE